MILVEHDNGIRKLNSEWDRRFTDLEENFYRVENENSQLIAEI